MNIITDYNEFLNEAPKLGDISKLSNINSKETFDIMNDYQNDKFTKNDKLIDVIILPKSNKIINIKWNDRIDHDIKKKIEDRTNCKNISEFNELFQDCLNLLFDKYFYEIDRDQNKYTIHLTQRNINFLLKFKYDDLFENDFTIFVITIVNSSVLNIKNINIEEL